MPSIQNTVVDQFVEEETEEKIQWLNEFSVAHDYNKELYEREMNEFMYESEPVRFNFVTVAID